MPLAPRAGPTGGDGVALAAECNAERQLHSSDQDLAFERTSGDEQPAIKPSQRAVGAPNPRRTHLTA